MAKKSSGNAVKKLDKQIEELTKKNKSGDTEKTPIINKKSLDEEIKKYDNEHNNYKKNNAVSNNNKNSKKKNTKKNNKNNKNSYSNNYKRKNKNTNTSKNNDITKKIDTNTDNNKTEEKEVYKSKKSVSESTIKLNKLEDEMRSLYDKVNDITSDLDNDNIEDIDYVKTVELANDIVITDKEIKKTESDEDVGGGCLTTLLIIVFILFMILLAIFIGFIIFICTF